ncbi:MAG TPA: DUF1841 family protein [Planctomycetota bacterium]|jgi:hypothetical protein
MTELNAAVLADLWKHAKAKKTPKEPFLQSVLRFMLLHENFHPWWDKLEADPTIPLMADGENLVVHIAMDAAAEKAIQDDRPEGIRELFEDLQARGMEKERAFHVISKAMADEFLVAGEEGEPMDLVKFYARAKEYAARA